MLVGAAAWGVGLRRRCGCAWGLGCGSGAAVRSIAPAVGLRVGAGAQGLASGGG